MFLHRLQVFEVIAMFKVCVEIVEIELEVIHGVELIVKAAEKRSK